MQLTRFFVPVLFAAIACTKTVIDPAPGVVTIKVTNTTCISDSCAPIHVLAFPDKQPLTPGGMWSLDLGIVSTRTACLTLPDHAEFTVSGPSPSDKVVYTWTSADRVSLGAISTSESRIQAHPSTDSFVPTESKGWEITMPAGARVTASGECAG